MIHLVLAVHDGLHSVVRIHHRARSDLATFLVGEGRGVGDVVETASGGLE